MVGGSVVLCSRFMGRAAFSVFPATLEPFSQPTLLGDERMEPNLDESVPGAKLDALMKACKEFKRQDLYRPLSYVLNLNVRRLSRNLKPFVKKARYVLAANVMLYGSKNNLARKYLRKARALTRPESPRRRRLAIVLNNLPVVARIARREAGSLASVRDFFVIISNRGRT